MSGGHNNQFDAINIREKPGLNLKSYDLRKSKIIPHREYSGKETYLPYTIPRREYSSPKVASDTAYQNVKENTPQPMTIFAGFLKGAVTPNSIQFIEISD
jgi:hypothetical protein